MDFNLSREHQLIRKMMAEFTENEVKPIAAETAPEGSAARAVLTGYISVGKVKSRVMP